MYYFYPDDNQINATLKPLIIQATHDDIEAYLKNINYWMNINKLKFNDNKAELLVMQSQTRTLPPLQNINCGTEMIKLRHSAWNNHTVNFLDITLTTRKVCTLLKTK